MVQETERCPSRYASAVLHIPTPNNHDGIELEMVGTKGRTDLYLNTLYSSLDPNGHSPGSSEVVVEIDGLAYTYEGRLLAGGQKVILPQEATDQIVESLRLNRSVKVCAGIHRCAIPSKGFSENYRKFASIINH